MSDNTQNSNPENRLSEEESPYLLQHSDNPVNWQPWDEDALKEARERDVPIFLSIGYSACHWCHVMEEESFEDNEVAELLNENFVPIKVDREERPDLDSIYQTICQMATRRGGWPLSVWLTPDQKPFYVGTYYPKNSKRGRPGFVDVLEDIIDSWENDRKNIEKRAEDWSTKLKKHLEDNPTKPIEGDEERDKDLVIEAAETAVSQADREYGGFGKGQKFPQATRIDVLFQGYKRKNIDAYRDVTVETLDAMVKNGLRDHVGGGFHRYVTDREWVVPHFEKMLYDNAEIPRILLEAYRAIGKDEYAEAAEETFRFVEREMRHSEGGFYSTLDAQSEGEEGKFYVWTPEEVSEAIEEDYLSELFCERYGITERGNFEGSNVLTISKRVDEIAEERGEEPDRIAEKLEKARELVFEAREERVRPDRDEKILAGWNGLMVSALARGNELLDEKWGGLAGEALEFVRDNHWNEEEKRLRRRYKNGEIEIDGYLEDYAFLARGALDLYQATTSLKHLEFSLSLAEIIVEEFWDEENQTIYFTPKSAEELVARPQEVMDQSTPSSLGVALDVLLSLDHFRSDDKFFEVAEKVVDTHLGRTRNEPLQHASLLLATDRYLNGSVEITITDKSQKNWMEKISETYIPTRVLTVRPDDVTDALARLGMEDEPPIWKGRDGEGDEPKIYVCRSFTCSPPLSDIDAAFEWIEDLGPEAK